jgi:hypothetical protein
METQPDFRELLALFNARHVEYLIVGGYALAFHGVPRFTGDLDIFVKPDAVNAQRILHALEAFGFASVGRVAGRYGDTPVYYIGREQFVANKRATGRTKDVADLEVLGEA